MFFRPNGFKQQECARYVIPYGYITKLNESSNETKSQGTITLHLKDERIFKFKFENNPGQYRETLQIIGKYALVSKPEQLFCYQHY